MISIYRKARIYSLLLLAIAVPMSAPANPLEPRTIKASMERIICVEIANKRDGYEAEADKIYRRLLADLDMTGDDSAVIAQLTLPIIMALKGRHPKHIEAYFTHSNQYETLKKTTRQRRCNLDYRHRLNSFLDYVATRAN